MAGLFVLGEQSRPVRAVYATIDYWACAKALSVPAPYPERVAKSFRGREATKAAPARAPVGFEEAAMMAARRFAAASCRAAAGQADASPGAVNCRAGDHLGASLDSMNCLAADRLGASLDAGPDRETLRAARRPSARAD